MSKFMYIEHWFYVPSITLSRVSVVVLYLRIFASRLARLCSWMTLAFFVATGLVLLVGSQLECRPLEYMWNKEIDGHCINQPLWWQLSNIPNVIADVALLLLPIPTVWTLHASKMRRTGIAIVFIMGSM